MIMVYDARLSCGVHRQLLLEEQTKVVFIPADHMVDFWRVKEVCAGVGGFSQGLSYAGFETVALFDLNPLACMVMEMNYRAPVLCGDLLNSQDRYLLHVTPCALRCVFTCGFPCQPLSVQGDLRGERDSRALPFFYALKMFWEQQGSSLCMECVPNASRAPYVQRALQQLAWSLFHLYLYLSFPLQYLLIQIIYLQYAHAYSSPLEDIPIILY